MQGKSFLHAFLNPCLSALMIFSFCQYTHDNSNSTPLLHTTPYKQSKTTTNSPSTQALPPHAYRTADEAYRSMMRGLENGVIMKSASKKSSAKARIGKKSLQADTTGVLPANQSILVSGESGAGKTVTTKIVLNYFAMLSKKVR